MIDSSDFGIGTVGVALIGLLIIILVFKLFERKRDDSAPVELKSESCSDNEKPAKDFEENKLTSKQKKGTNAKKKEPKEPSFSHEYLLTSLKGHTGQILDLDFNSSGKYLASCGDDRQVMLWSVKTFNEKNHRCVRANIEYDHATLVKWSPDSKAFIVAVANENAIQVHKLSKKKDGTLGNVEVIMRFPVHHNTDIISIGIACNGLFIMSCSSDTTMNIWSLKGEILATLDTLHINNYCACISPCGRFVASSGFTPDVRVWEVCFTKTGEFREVKRAFELKDHTSGVYSFCFSNDSSRMVSISKDGTWKLWDTNIEYSKGQEPYLMNTVKLLKTNVKSLITLSPDGRTIAACTGSDLYLYSAISGELQSSILDVHSDGIRSMLFSPDGHYLVASAGRHIRVFKNVPGYQNIILDLESAKKHASNSTTRERLQAQIDDAKSTLQSLVNPSQA